MCRDTCAEILRREACGETLVVTAQKMLDGHSMLGHCFCSSEPRRKGAEGAWMRVLERYNLSSPCFMRGVPRPTRIPHCSCDPTQIWVCVLEGTVFWLVLRGNHHFMVPLNNNTWVFVRRSLGSQSAPQTKLSLNRTVPRASSCLSLPGQKHRRRDSGPCPQRRLEQKLTT